MPALSLTDTICALATVPAPAHRCVVRLSGPGAFGVLPGARPTTRCALRAVLSLPGAVASSVVQVPALLVCFPGPRSFTGEDAAELSFAGNPHLAERVLAELVARPGVRQAQPGEFSARAFLNLRYSLDEAEGIAATIAARTDEELSAARHLLSGTTGERYRRWADECTTLLALVEAGIDFTDQEDVVAISPMDLAARAVAVAVEVQAHTGTRAGAEVGGAVPTVALAGRPNAGKSTLFNALLSRDRAVASPVAGTTRDVLREELDLSREAPGAGVVHLLDVAGLSEDAGRGTDAEAQRRALEAILGADVVLWCDPSGEFRESDSPLHRHGSTLRHLPTVIRVRTFGDQPGGQKALSSGIAVCALDHWNLGALRRAIADQTCSARGAGVAALLPRHRRCLASAHGHLMAAAAGANTPELAATSLRGALDDLAELVGAVSPDDVIGRVFAMFCVGK